MFVVADPEKPSVRFRILLIADRRKKLLTVEQVLQALMDVEVDSKGDIEETLVALHKYRPDAYRFLEAQITRPL